MASFFDGGIPSDWAIGPRRAAVELLLQAAGFSQDAGCDPWDLAVEFQTLRVAGLTDTDLRWLLKKTYLLHRIETTANGADRCFLASGGLKFTADSCFVLTREGDCFFRSRLHPGSLLADRSALFERAAELPRPAEELFRSEGSIESAASRPLGELPRTLSEADEGGREEMSSTLLFPGRPRVASSRGGEIRVETSALGHVRVGAAGPPQPLILEPDVRPKWHDDRRELWLGPVLVKRFRFRSPNQEMLLTAFEEEQWPIRLDDPLPPVPNQTSKQRLHDAIKNLNRHHMTRVIRFAGDGTGEGVRWERVG